MHMAEHFSSSPSYTPDSAPRRVIPTRFGEITVDSSEAMQFARGLLGMPDRKRYVLSAFPSEKMAQFRLLQSLDDFTLSLIALPLELDNPIIAREDLIIASQDIGIPLGSMLPLLVVSVYRTPEHTRITVNARAPLLLDTGTRQGLQYVFPHGRYKVQHVIKE